MVEDPGAYIWSSYQINALCNERFKEEIEAEKVGRPVGWRKTKPGD